MLRKPIASLAALLLLLAAGCADEELSPVVTQDNLLFGAFPRLVELRTGEYDLNDLQNSAYEMEVDFVDNAEGQDIAEYRIYAEFDDRTVDSLRPDLSTPEVLIRNYTPAEFRPGPNGNLGVDVNIPFAEVASATGVPVDSVFAGDRFQFRVELEKKDGRVFQSTNSTPAITNAFGGIIDFNVNATCPLPDDSFVGTYVITYGSVYDAFALFGADVQPFGPEPFSREVTLQLVPGSTTRRSFSIGSYLLPGYGFDAGTVTLDFACDQVTSTPIDSGAGCGDGTIAATQSGRAPFNFTDDQTWTISYTDFGDTDGGCGVGGLPFSLVFTKQ